MNEHVWHMIDVRMNSLGMKSKHNYFPDIQIVVPRVASGPDSLKLKIFNPYIKV